MAITVVTLHGRFLGLDQATPMAGTVSFILTGFLQDTQANTIIPPSTTVATLDGAGAFSTSLLALDDSFVTPHGLQYQVVENLVGRNSRSYYISLSAAQLSQELADLVPAAAGTATYVLAATMTGTDIVAAIPVGTYAQGLVSTAVKTAPYTAAPKDYVLTDATAGSINHPLPTAPPNGTRIGYKMVATSGTNVVTFTCGGSDHINLPTGPTSGTITLLNQAVVLQYATATAVWTVQSSDLPLSQLDTRFVGISQTQAGTIPAPTPTTIFAFQPRDPAKATFVSLVHGAPFTFGGTTQWDEVWSWGYNYGPGGTVPVASEPNFCDQLETSYLNPGTGVNTVERFWQYGPPNEAWGSGIRQRPIFLAYNRTPGVTRSAAVISFLLNAPIFTFNYPNNDGSDATMATIQRNVFTVYSPDTGNDTILNTTAAVGHNSSIQLGANGVASRLLVGTSGVDAAFIQLGDKIPIFLNRSSTLGANVAINSTSNLAGLVIDMGPTHNAIGGLYVIRKAGTASDMFAVQQASTLVPLTRMNKNGILMTSVATAPVLADMTDGEIAIYTDGAGALKVAQRISGVLTIKTATLT